MFHISSKTINDSIEGQDNNEVLTFVCNIFNIKNILIYIIGLVVSIISIKGKMYPFALSILGASVCTQIPIIGILVTTSIGLIYITDISVFVKYLITIVLFIAFNTIIKPKKSKNDRNEIYKLTYRLMVFNFLIQFFGAGSISFGEKLLFVFLHSSFVYLGYKICICGIATIKNINNKQVFSNIELISAGLLISIVLFALKGRMIFNINITNLCIVFLLFYISFKNGSICGGISGLVIGLFGLIYSKCDLLYLINITLTGICGGLFGEYGKIVSLSAVVISNLLFSAIIQGNPLFFINLAGILLMCVLTLFIKNNTNIDIDDLISKVPLLEEKFETSLVENQMPKEEIKIINDTQEEHESYIKDKTEFLEKFYSSFNKKNNNLLYEEITQNKSIIEQTYDKIKRGEVIDKESFIKVLEASNYYIVAEDKNIKNSVNQIIRLINKTYNQATKKTN